MAPLITLLTDFGTSDSYVAEVKAVLLSRALGAALVDVTHQIPPGDVRSAQYVLAHLGSPIADPYRVPLPAPHFDGTAVRGEVIYVDRFGTLISNIPGERVEPGVRIKVAGTEVGVLCRTFGDVERGQLVAFVGSGGGGEIGGGDGRGGGGWGGGGGEGGRG